MFLTVVLLEAKQSTSWISGYMMMMMMMMMIIIIIIIIITFIQYMNRSHKNGLFKPGEYISTWRIFEAREYLKLAIYIS